MGCPDGLVSVLADLAGGCDSHKKLCSDTLQMSKGLRVRELKYNVKFYCNY